ncbi:TPA: class I SAM-dependent rRNA methyltransferase [Streptococcus suis]|nr:class I SAM-dependent rRNA methyltransferase [Streptococcus suis]
MKIKVNRIAEQKINRGIQLLDSADFSGFSFDEDRLAVLYSESGSYLGQAYLSKQNKGIGWLFSRSNQDLTMDFFVKLFVDAKQKRQHFYQSEMTNAFRLFNQDGDNFGGMTVDLYDEYAVFSWYNTFIYSVKEMIVAAFQQVFPEVRGAYEKIRFKALAFESAHLYGEEAPEYFTVLENGVHYQVFMNDGLMTGIFLDQHEVRGSLVDGLVAGKSLLNMFSYTAAFSIAAAMGGAGETTSVDLAKDYHKLISQSLEILNTGGTIIASTNAANVSVEKFKRQIEKGFGVRKHRYEASYRLPADFVINKNDESSNYLKVFTIQVDK